jgi:hypothetical protein
MPALQLFYQEELEAEYTEFQYKSGWGNPIQNSRHLHQGI